MWNTLKMQTEDADRVTIQSIATDYVESWLDGDGERMRSTLHPALAKRGLDDDADGRLAGPRFLDAEEMERSAAKGPRPQYAQTCEVTILDLAGDIASVKVVSEPFVDYLHMVKLDGRWSIINVLWMDLPPDG